jgi:hypothetical protein
MVNLAVSAHGQHTIQIWDKKLVAKPKLVHLTKISATLK